MNARHVEASGAPQPQNPAVARALAAWCLYAAAIPVFLLNGINYGAKLFDAVLTRALYSMADLEFVPSRFDKGIAGPLVGTAAAIIGWMVFKRLIEILVLGAQQWSAAGSRKSRAKLASDSIDAGVAMIKPDWLRVVALAVGAVVPAVAGLVGLFAYEIYAAGLWPWFVKTIN